MKYLKITMAAFAIALCLSLVGVNATAYYTIRGIKIPAFSVAWTSEQVDKGFDDEYQQRVKKISCTDNLSGDGRAISGNIFGLLSNNSISTGYKSLPDGKNISFGTATIAPGAWKLQLKSDKWLATTATADVNWDIGSLMYPGGDQPYPGVGLN